jgi:hypothetical protein
MFVYDLTKLASSRENTLETLNQGETNCPLIMISLSVFGLTYVNDYKAILVVKTGMAMMEKSLAIVRFPSATS